MKILFDQGTPLPLRRHLESHQVDTASECGWSELSNGDLLAQAEAEGYEVFITTDQQLRRQQNLTGRKLRVLVLMTTAWPRIQSRADQVGIALESLGEGGYLELEF